MSSVCLRWNSPEVLVRISGGNLSWLYHDSCCTGFPGHQNRTWSVCSMQTHMANMHIAVLPLVIIVFLQSSSLLLRPWKSSVVSSCLEGNCTHHNRFFAPLKLGRIDASWKLHLKVPWTAPIHWKLSVYCVSKFVNVYLYILIHM